MKTRFSSTEPPAPAGYVNGQFAEVVEGGIRKVAVHVPVSEEISIDARTRSVGVIIDGGNSVIMTGIKHYIRIPFSCTIISVTLLADQTGSIVVDIWKDTYANFPPTDADSITASTPPTISGNIKSEDVVLSGWTTTINAGDILGFNVDSITAINRVTVQLEVMT